MFLRAFAAGWFFVSFAGLAWAGDEKPDIIPEEARVAWLKKHVAPLRTIDPADDDFADLEPIRKAIGDSRIVQLSEQTHGDGATFHAKTRLIKFLHQKCGFDVLAFESGLFDCRKAWEILRDGKMPYREAIGQGVFGIWTGAEEVQPLLEYLGKQSRAARPLEICGFDCQCSGPAAARFLPGEMGALLKKLPAESLTAKQRAAAVKACANLANIGTGISDDEKDALAACRKVLLEMKATDELNAKELAFWRQMTKSALALAEVESATKDRIKTKERNPINLRDIQMGDNFIWQAREAYPKRKIIVWAAAFHLLRNQEQVAMVMQAGKDGGPTKTTFPYPKITTMGSVAWKELEKETYSIFFTAADGQFQTIRMAQPKKLAAVLKGSFEDLFIKAGSVNGFLDLRGRDAGGRWLEERLVNRTLGNADHEADWTKVCDGLVFTRTMYGATPAKADTLASRYDPKKVVAALGVPFERYTTKDRFERTITFYLSLAAKSGAALPVAVLINETGCSSIFPKRGDKVDGGLPELLLKAGEGRFRVLVVERPGVKFGDAPKDPMLATAGTEEYRRERVPERWVEAVNAAMIATHRLDGVDWKRTLAIGHADGGIAAKLAAANSLVTHVAVLSGGGMPVGELSASTAPVFVGYGKADDAPGDHSGLRDVFGKAAEWYREKRSPIEAAIDNDIAKFQGDWRVVSLESDGVAKAPAGAFANLRLAVNGETRTMQSGKNLISQARFRLDPTTQPPTIEVTVTVGGQRGQTMLGIYEVTADRMRICLASPGSERPRDFATKAGTGNVLQELKRMPPA